MNCIPTKLRAELAADPTYSRCMRQELLHDHVCQTDPIRGRFGRMIEWEHALYYGSNEIQERFAIVPLCWYAHRGPGQNKEINVWLALNRATDEELLGISKAINYLCERARLNAKYGVPALTRLLEDIEGCLEIAYI